MKASLRNFSLVVVSMSLSMGSTAFGSSVVSDDFEDGVIDPSLWTVGGATRGTGGFGGGSWQWSHDEVVVADGYLNTRVWGPTSANSFGGEGWVQTTYDYNDGSDYRINFRWQTTVNANHVDMYAIQLTDGSIPGGGDAFWYGDKNIGSIDGATWDNVYFEYEKPAMPTSDWSIKIDGTNNLASIYNGPNLTGQRISQNTLDPSHPWHMRFIHADATSGGFPAGDNSLNIFDYQAVYEPTWTAWPFAEGGNGHRYALTSGLTSWTDAEAEAVALGGHLVTINDAAEQTWLNGQFPFPDQYWIGLFQDIGDPGYSEPDGGWVWINGEPVTYTNWATSFGEPNNGGGQDPEQWGAMHVWAEGLWNDYPDATLLLGIIEIPQLVGDLDGDGFVGIADLNIVLANWNQSVPPGNPLADPSGDGFVGIDDLNEVLGNWNAGTLPPVEASSVVPEPATLGFFLAFGSALLRRGIG